MLAGLLVLVFVSAPIMGCSIFNKEEDYVPEDPADKLYNEGLFLLNNKQDYDGAAKKFDEVDRQNPYSDWARKALLMSAYSYSNNVRKRGVGADGGRTSNTKLAAHTSRGELRHAE